MRISSKKRPFSERGQALVMITFAIVGLIGMVGLAIDGGIAFSDRRHAQNAADAAAYAGALGKINPLPELGSDPVLSMQYLATDRAYSNGYGNNPVRSTVEVYTCDDENASCESQYVGDPNYVQVIITSHVNTFFAHIVGVSQVHNRVQAVALAVEYSSEPLYDENAIVALAPTGKGCDGEFIIGGSGSKDDEAKIHIKGGGIFVNSDNTLDDLDSTTCGAFVQDGCVTELDFEDGGGITSVGNINLNKTCPEKLEGPMVEGVEQVEFPPKLVLPPPDECEKSGEISNNSGTKTSTLKPGYYDNIPPKAAAFDEIILQPGNYCLSNFQVSSKVNVTGSDVFFYIKPGGSFDFSGGEMTLSAPTDEKDTYRGYLVYVAQPDQGFESCKITGNSDMTFTGTIFAPFCDITMNGTSNPEGIRSQIIGYTVKLNGSGNLYILYDPGDNGVDVTPAQLGIAQ